jgi:hypothetical protein
VHGPEFTKVARLGRLRRYCLWFVPWFNDMVNRSQQVGNLANPLKVHGAFQIVHVVHGIFAGHLPFAAAQIDSSPSKIHGIIHGIPLLDR